MRRFLLGLQKYNGATEERRSEIHQPCPIRKKEFSMYE
jgi:hypothetical protein